MNREEILNMEAGEQLDKVVAEKVMGWHIESTPEWSNPHWVDANGGYAAGIKQDDGWYEDSEDLNLLNWHPSGSILWAMDYVVDKMISDYDKGNKYPGHDPIFITRTDDNKKWYVEFAVENWEYAEHESLPVAICYAALLTVMENEK